MIRLAEEAKFVATSDLGVKELTTTAKLFTRHDKI